MAQLGMDVDLVEQAGRELQAKAAAIDTLTAQVERSVNSLRGVWDGRDADAFIDQWPAFKKALAVASQSVAGLGQSAINNASEQRQVSGSSGTSAQLSGLAAAATGAQPSLEDQFWSTTGNTLNSTVPGTPWTVEQLGGLIPHVSDGLSVMNMANSLHSGQVPIAQMIDTAGGALRSSGTGPVTYLAGAAISTWDYTVQQAMQIQPPPDINTIVTLTQQDPFWALEGATDGIVKAVPDLIANLLP